MPRHPAGDGVDRELHLHALLPQQVGQLPRLVLRLGHGQAVARDHDHAIAVGHEHSGILRAGLADDLLLAVTAAHRRRLRPEGAEEHVGQRPVHGPAHDVREDQPRGAHQRAGDDQHVVAQHEARGRRRQPGVRVQQRHHHGHVRPADGHDEQDPEQERQRGQHQEQVERGAGLDRDPRAGPDERGEQQRVDHLLGRVGQRLLEVALQLGPGDEAAAERHRPDQYGEHDREGDVDRRARGGRLQELRRGHQRRGAAAEGVEHRHHLRHGGHLDPAGQEGADAAADHEADDDPGPVEAAVQERGHDGQQHAQRAQHVPAPGGLRVAQSLQSEDEEDGGDQIRNLDDEFHRLTPSSLPSS